MWINKINDKEVQRREEAREAREAMLRILNSTTPLVHKVESLSSKSPIKKTVYDKTLEKEYALLKEAVPHTDYVPGNNGDKENI